MITVNHLNLAFGDGEKRNQVLSDVTFAVQPGRYMAWWASRDRAKPRC